jgi:hypothetical protein
MAKAKQSRLPGTEDAAIQELEDAAVEHSDALGEIRKEREGLKEIDARLATLMKKAGKTSYNHNGVTLKLQKGKDKVSVKVKRHEPKEDEEAA